jgi:fibronectin type 3 domain-containing protein
LPFSVTFAPQAAGTSTGSLAFVTNASSSPTATLTGSGSQAAAAHSVSLSWSASTSPVAGYNIYRSVQPGGPYAKLTTSPTPSTAYADTAVQSGSTYYYVATSVNNSSEESGYSNQSVATVP